MYDYEVFFLFDGDEILLGTVGEIIGIEGTLTHGGGISITAVISDIVSDITDNPETNMSRVFRIELRERKT